MLVQVVILNLTEIPVIGIHDLTEHFRIPVVGKADLSDGAAFLLFCNPVLNPQSLQPFPCFHVVEHVHQIVIHMIRSQALQFLREQLFNPNPVSDQVMGQFRCDFDLIPQSVLLQNLPQRRLTAAVDVSRIKIIDSAVHRQPNFPLRFFQINPSQLLGKPQTPEAKHGKPVPISIRPVMHEGTLPIKTDLYS